MNKPQFCPFCGENDYLEIYQINNRGFWNITCNNCNRSVGINKTYPIDHTIKPLPKPDDETKEKLILLGIQRIKTFNELNGINPYWD